MFLYWTTKVKVYINEIVKNSTLLNSYNDTIELIGTQPAKIAMKVFKNSYSQ